MAKAKTIACVGDSITFGLTVENRDVHSYPAVLQTLVNEHWKVINFGENGATAIRDTPKFTPFTKRRSYQKSLDSNPSIVVIMLGANDSKPAFWDKKAYRDHMISLINEYKSLPSQPEIFLGTPVKSFNTKQGPWDVNEGNLSVARGIIASDIARVTGSTLIEVTPHLDSKSYFSPDGVHPNKEGAKAIAKAIFAGLKDHL